MGEKRALRHAAQQECALSSQMRFSDLGSGLCGMLKSSRFCGQGSQ